MKINRAALYLFILCLGMSLAGCKLLKKEKQAADSTDQSRLIRLTPIA